MSDKPLIDQGTLLWATRFVATEWRGGDDSGIAPTSRREALARWDSWKGDVDRFAYVSILRRTDTAADWTVECERGNAHAALKSTLTDGDPS